MLSSLCRFNTEIPPRLFNIGLNGGGIRRRTDPGVRRPYSDVAWHRDQLEARGVESVAHVRGQSLITARRLAASC
ncbi:hypothetical protein ES332_D03G065400v1 [Gossypium tomentosum]|uniref:Uncharacterized protein n=1 Tax=Gossypium tomentosum TaxID=34277 RepID=A0A5D2LLB4_GOSTO|nr:hypothetical protein ES332_D03G065400v1 [Gossypium tomentosum]